jgi:hypothetical protein
VAQRCPRANALVTQSWPIGEVVASAYNVTMPEKKGTNPFYVVLIGVGVVFAITACAYGVMTVRGLDPHAAEEEGLVGLMDKHGLTIMMFELALLGVLTVLAIGTDHYWTGTPASHERQPPEA